MWDKGTLILLMVGVQACMATTEISLAVPQEAGTRSTQSSLPVTTETVAHPSLLLLNS